MENSSLICNISFLAKEARKNIILATSNELRRLHLQIGAELIRTNFKNNNLEIIYQHLKINYGISLNHNKINIIRKLPIHNTCSPYIEKLIQFLNWKHIGILSKIVDEKAKLSYIEQAIANFSIVGSKKLEKGNLHRKAKYKKIPISQLKTPSNKFQNTASIQVENKNTSKYVVRNCFKNTSSEIYSIFNKKEHRRNISLGNYSNDVRAVLVTIENLIFNFKEQQNQWLNGNLNFLYWRIGRLIMENREQEFISRPTLQIRLAKCLKKKGEIFSEKLLSELVLFANVVKEMPIAIKLSYLVPWNYIVRILLNTNDGSLALYYGEMCSKKELTLAQLDAEMHNKKSIANKSFMSQTRINIIRERTKQRIGNSSFIGDTEFIDFENNTSKAISNTLKSNLFLQFIKGK